MFKLDIDGITVNLGIKGYRTSSKDNWDVEWCNCDFLMEFNKWLNYAFYDREILLMCEVEELEKMLTKFINNEIKEYTELSFIEPDFEFKLYPDNILEWEIHFWNGGLTANFLTITLDRDDAIVLRDYILTVINT